MNCDFCGREEALPFICNYCGGAFCADHRLPEAHLCKGDLTQKRTIVAPPQTTFSWQTSSVPQERALTPSGSNVFSRIEVRDILIAWLGIGVAVAIAFSGGALYFSGSTVGRLFFLTIVALVTVGPGFIFHELSHKFVARHYGFWAEFRMWPQMLAMAILISLVGFLFAAPGATYISGNDISKSENGIISLAGPLTNAAIASLFSLLFLYGGPLSAVGGFGMWVNIELGVFNLVPFGPLDGAKVFRWNKMIWALAIGSLVVAAYSAVVYGHVLSG